MKEYVFGDERIRLMTPAEGPTLLSRLSTTQAVALKRMQ
jgi:hypothetical protein